MKSSSMTGFPSPAPKALDPATPHQSHCSYLPAATASEMAGTTGSYTATMTTGPFVVTLGERFREVGMTQNMRRGKHYRNTLQPPSLGTDCLPIHLPSAQPSLHQLNIKPCRHKSLQITHSNQERTCHDSQAGQARAFSGPMAISLDRW